MNGEKKSLIEASKNVALHGAGRAQAPTISETSDPAEVAIGLILEAGVATRDQEARVAQAIRDMEQIIRTQLQKLREVEKRASDAEAGLDQTREEMNALIERLSLARDSLAGLRDAVLAREDALAAMNERAEIAKQQALDMSAVLSMLIEEIRSRLPNKFDTGP
jgi:chromosome segregation ATPase